MTQKQFDFMMGFFLVLMIGLIIHSPFKPEKGSNLGQVNNAVHEFTMSDMPVM